MFLPRVVAGGRTAVPKEDLEPPAHLIVSASRTCTMQTVPHTGTWRLDKIELPGSRFGTRCREQDADTHRHPKAGREEQQH